LLSQTIGYIPWHLNIPTEGEREEGGGRGKELIIEGPKIDGLYEDCHRRGKIKGLKC